MTPLSERSPVPRSSNATDATRRHYESLLAPIYRWMLGDMDAALARAGAELESFGVGPARPGGRALDLGAGLGLQSIPLVDLGYRVTAVDSSEELLTELAASRPTVTLVPLDLLSLGDLEEVGHDVVVCMGDTLTHLPSGEAVDRMLAIACEKLAPGGVLALTFRDYASAERAGADRFVLVRATDRRILTCCLDYDGERVHVTDVVHERQGGEWSMRASTYDKLRLSGEWVAARLRSHGAVVVRSEISAGRVALVARKPADNPRAP